MSVVENSQVLSLEVGDEEVTPVTKPLQAESVQTMSFEELSQSVEAYEKKLADMKISATPLEPDKVIVQGTTMPIDFQTADQQRQITIDALYRFLEMYVDWIRLQAQEAMKPLLHSTLYLPICPFLSQTNTTNETQPKEVPTSQQIHEQMSEFLDLCSKPTDYIKWQQYSTELRHFIEETMQQQLQLKHQVEQAMKTRPQTTSYFLAEQFLQILSNREQYLQTDVDIIIRVYTLQHKLLHYCLHSYFTFYQGLLSHWHRSLADIKTQSEQNLSNIRRLFDQVKDQSDLGMLIHTYEHFLKSQEKHLPLEFRISAHPRREWKQYLSENQPLECVRMIQSELQMMLDACQDKNRDLFMALSDWQREFAHYNVQKSQQKVKRQAQLRKQLEDVVESETAKMCLGRWEKLMEYIHTMGIGFHQQVSEMVARLNQKQAEKKQLLLFYTQPTQVQKQNLKAHLSRSDPELALLLEQREHNLEHLFTFKYRLLSVNAMFELWDICKEIAPIVQTTQV